MTNLLQPADVCWFSTIKKEYKKLWSDWYMNEEKIFTISRNLKSPGYVKCCEWLNSIWNDFDTEKIKKSFEVCGVQKHVMVNGQVRVCWNKLHTVLRTMLESNKIIHNFISEERDVNEANLQADENDPGLFAEVLESEIDCPGDNGQDGEDRELEGDDSDDEDEMDVTGGSKNTPWPDPNQEAAEARFDDSEDEDLIELELESNDAYPAHEMVALEILDALGPVVDESQDEENSFLTRENWREHVDGPRSETVQQFISVFTPPTTENSNSSSGSSSSVARTSADSETPIVQVRRIRRTREQIAAGVTLESLRAISNVPK